MADITLYGHLTLDNIITKNKQDLTVGSIGNVWHCLNTIDPTLNIFLQPTDFGEALILIDTEKAVRASVANLSTYTKKPIIYESKWHHILYINEMKSIDFIKNIKNGIVSVDFCRGRKLKNIDILNYVDIAFISDEDIFMDLRKMSKLTKIGVVMHHKGGSEYYSKGEKVLSNTVKIINNVNVLGCGDKFASCFINCQLNNQSIEESIINSHDYVTKILLGEKSEK